MEKMMNAILFLCTRQMVNVIVHLNVQLQVQPTVCKRMQLKKILTSGHSCPSSEDFL